MSFILYRSISYFIGVQGLRGAWGLGWKKDLGAVGVRKSGVKAFSRSSSAAARIQLPTTGPWEVVCVILLADCCVDFTRLRYIGSWPG